jgi:flagellar hook-associated protein 3 FlgL
MTRITEMQMGRSLTHDILANREQVRRYSDEVSSGLKVAKPSDSYHSGTISQFRESVDRMAGYQQRVHAVKGLLEFQDNTLSEAGDLLIRAKEIASQASNSFVSPETRLQMAEEVYEIREHMVALANSTYQGKYVFSGGADDVPAYSTSSTYTTPVTGRASERYTYTTEPGATLTREVKVGDEVKLQVNSAGNGIFDTAIAGLEVLTRALEGYSTTLDGTTGLPTGAGTAFTFPQDFGAQTSAIAESIALLDEGRQEDIQLERVSIGGRLRRLDTAKSVLDLSKQTAEEVLNEMQNADITVSASNLADAQTALEASYTVTSRVLQLSVLDYL